MKTNTKYIVFICFIAALGGFLFGFDTAVISGANLYIQPYFGLTDWEFGFVVSSMLIGCAMGGLFAGGPADKYGRRNMLMITAVLFTISAIGSALVTTTVGFVAFRFIGGIGVGAASMLSPIYISEIAPAKIRGKMISLNQLTIVVGVTVAFFSNYFLSELPETVSWRWMLGVESIPAILFLLLLFGLPKSPRWLMSKLKIEEANLVLQKIHGKEKAQQILKEIEMSLGKVKERQTFKNLFTKKNKPFVKIAVFLAVLQQVTGINAIMYYAPNIFASIGMAKSSAMLQTSVIGITMTLFTILAMIYVDKLGRRKLLIVGSLGMMLMLLLLSLLFYVESSNSYLILGSILGYIAFFSFSAGPVVWVLIGEIIPNAIRSKGIAIAAFSIWVANYMVTLTFPTLLNSFTGSQRGFTFIIYAFFCLILLVYTYYKIPETKGKTLEQIELIFNKKL